MEPAVVLATIQMSKMVAHVMVMVTTRTGDRIAVVVLILVLKIANKIWILKKDRISKNCV